jgi:hypothetical protein
MNFSGSSSGVVVREGDRIMDGGAGAHGTRKTLCVGDNI